MKGCDIYREGWKHIPTPPTYFRNQDTPNPTEPMHAHDDDDDDDDDDYGGGGHDDMPNSPVTTFCPTLT